jgi:hypothetical protein
LLAESVNDNVPERAPVALGENVTTALQLPPAASVEGLIGHVELTGKSVELLATEVIVKDEVWLLVSTTVCAALLVPKA